MKALSNELPVKYVAPSTTDGGKPTTRNVKIIEVLSPTTARLELGENSTALAAYSETKEPGTFHFPEDAANGIKAGDASPSADPKASAKTTA